MKTLCLECPEALHAQLQEFVKEGGAGDPQQVVLEALSRFLNAHEPASETETECEVS
jgi:hypothetical protein